MVFVWRSSHEMIWKQLLLRQIKVLSQTESVFGNLHADQFVAENLKRLNYLSPFVDFGKCLGLYTSTGIELANIFCKDCWSNCV